MKRHIAPRLDVPFSARAVVSDRRSRAGILSALHRIMDPLAGLSSDYQILTELYHSGESRTYLARHLTLNRDVTLTVVRTAGDGSYLTAFANDAELLKTQRHPNLVPVIEGRWLDEHTFAVARARVRGSSLEHLIDAVGTMPGPRIDAALREIAGALVFAREAGVTNRFISPQSLVFQQGTGRALIAFEPSRLIADDVQTLRELARRMNGGAQYDVSEFVRMLGAPAAATLTPTMVSHERAVSVPVQRDEPVVVRRRGMGFGARVFTTFVVLAVLVVAGWMFWPRHVPEPPRTASQAPASDTDTDAAGEVSLRSRIDTTRYPTPRIIEPEPVPSQAPAPASTPTPMPQPPLTTTSPVTPPGQLQVPPRRTEPIAPPAKLPVPVDTIARPADTLARASTSPADAACDSPLPSDQRQCLSAAIERSDSELNAVYRRLIAALRRQAGVTDDAPDPPSVDALRDAQRRWLEERDSACRSVGSGPLYARARAGCFAGRSSLRTAELQQQMPPE
jgi:uncharacterized protein YecT (DUF1311 family)